MSCSDLRMQIIETRIVDMEVEESIRPYALIRIFLQIFGATINTILYTPETLRFVSSPITDILINWDLYSGKVLYQLVDKTVFLNLSILLDRDRNLYNVIMIWWWPNCFHVYSITFRFEGNGIFGNITRYLKHHLEGVNKTTYELDFIWITNGWKQSGMIFVMVLNI